MPQPPDPAAAAPASKVLFLCTGNSARSILAEVIARHAGFDAASAGSHPVGTVNPHAIAALQARGLPTDGLRSKSWDEFSNCSFDIVVTVCDNAARTPCPVWPGSPRTLHWSLPDPAADPDPPRAFDRTFKALSASIGSELKRR